MAENHIFYVLHQILFILSFFLFSTSGYSVVSFLYSRVLKELCMCARKIREELFELRVCNDDSKTFLVYTTVENFFSAVKKTLTVEHVVP